MNGVDSCRTTSGDARLVRRAIVTGLTTGVVTVGFLWVAVDVALLFWLPFHRRTLVGLAAWRVALLLAWAYAGYRAGSGATSRFRAGVNRATCGVVSCAVVWALFVGFHRYVAATEHAGWQGDPAQRSLAQRFAAHFHNSGFQWFLSAHYDGYRTLLGAALIAVIVATLGGALTRRGIS